MIPFFSKLTTDQYNEILIWSCKKPLRLAILLMISARVRSSDSIIEWMKKWEFVLSENEYAKFWLEKNQKSQITRIINGLIWIWVIQKTKSKTKTKQATIFRYINNDFIDCSRESKDRNEDESKIEWRRTKNDKNEKNNINNQTQQKFNEFWSLYFRKEWKEKAKQKFLKLSLSEQGTAISWLKRHVEYWKNNNTELKFIPHPTTWINWRRWNDELANSNSMLNSKAMDDFWDKPF